MLELFHYDFFQNALLSTLFIGISCGLVGTYIVARRMVFISGGITHASFGGLGLSFYLGLPPMLGATCFALLSALGIQCLGARRKISEDSLIGIFWSAGMAIGILFIYLTPGYAPDLMSYLFGNILTVTPAQLILSAVLCGLILLFFALFSRPLFYIAFDREYSQTHHVRGGTLDTAATVITSSASNSPASSSSSPTSPSRRPLPPCSTTTSGNFSSPLPSSARSAPSQGCSPPPSSRHPPGQPSSSASSCSSYWHGVGGE